MKKFSLPHFLFYIITACSFNMQAQEGSQIIPELTDSIQELPNDSLAKNISNIQIPIIEKFENAELRNFEVKEVKDWMFYICLFLGFALALLYLFYGDVLNEAYVSTFNYNLANQIFRERERGFNWGALLLSLFALLIFAVSILSGLIYVEYALPWTWYSTLWFIYLVLLSLWFSRKLVHQFVASVFSFGDSLKLFDHHTTSMQQILGIALFPLLIGLFLGEDFVRALSFYGICFLPAVMLVYRYVKGLMIAKVYIRFSKFHFLMYICALEIAPYFLLVKLFMSQGAA